MNCETYDSKLHFLLTVSAGKNEGIVSSPSLLEYHLHAVGCDKHRLEYGQVVASAELSYEDKKAYSRGVEIIQENFHGIVTKY